VTRTLTWTFGLRDTFNSNPLNPQDQVARLRGSFSSIPHDNQPLNTVIQTHLGNLFSSTRWPFCSQERQLRGSSSRNQCSAPASEFSAISCRHSGRPDRHQSSLRQDVSGRSAWQRGWHCHSAGSANSAINAIVAANQTFTAGFPKGSLLFHR